MFGDNPIRKQDLDVNGGLWVSEVFATIQGEGPLAGTPAIFIRLSGCNLQCKFCDTDFESTRQYNEVTVLANRVNEAMQSVGGNIHQVVITGGEPFLQNIVPLIYALVGSGYAVQIETAGTVSIEDFPWAFVDVVVSPKAPKVHKDFYTHCEHWKYIISLGNYTITDGFPKTPSGKAIARPPELRDVTVWVQPMDEQDPNKNYDNQDLCVSLGILHGYRISLQTHKILGVE